uniref:Enhancer of polycomb homolog 1 n=1 Tax=Bos mutus grunniens TaxID=30521 RepID=A0A8B9YHR0_BOSMU
MSKLSFRARALDASKPLPVFRCEDLPDLHEYASINRAVPQMPTGMEKEEESVQPLKQGQCVDSSRSRGVAGLVLQFCGGKLYCNTSVWYCTEFFNVEILLCTVDFENKAVETVWVVQPFKVKEL